MLDQIKTDIDAVMHRDPAAKTRLEAALCYPGLHAIWLHRLAHKLYLKGWVLIPRLLNTFSRFLTGIDIHPGATLGPGLFIDHGMGLVIGETAELGSNVTLYQGVTLGGTGKEKGKRHPTIGDNVVVSSGAKVLGSFTVGSNSKIGAGSVVLKEVPPNSVVVGVPGRIVTKDGVRIAASDMSSPDSMIDLNHNQLPDPVADYEDRLADYMVRMDSRLEELEEIIKKHLQEAGHEVVDNGVGEGEVELYPDVAVRTCNKVTDKTCERGILVCGTGIGMAMTANKVPGIRAAVCHDPFSTERSILSNNGNVMCMGARVVAPQLALYLLDIWMGLTFKDGPSTEKVERITYYENQFCGK